MTFKEFMQENGYELQTTFWEDFSIADRFGLTAIQDTFNRAFEEWKEHYKYLTELILVLNHKIWQYHDTCPELQHCIIAYGKRQTYMLLKTLKGRSWTIFMK